MFRNISSGVKSTYSSLQDDVGEEFYNKVLSESMTYNRVSGYFSSKALAMYSKGLEFLASKNGKVRFIISIDISKEDFLEIQNGYTHRETFDESDLNEIDRKNIGNLAFLIAKGNVDIKFALVKQGIFHSKWGYFEDEQNEIIYFNGSNNETFQAINNNYEDFDVDTSWDTSLKIQERIESKIELFELLWTNKIPNVEVVEATNTVYNMISEFNKGELQYGNVFENSIILDCNELEEYLFIDNSDDKLTTTSRFKTKLNYYIDEQRGAPFLRNNLTYNDLEEVAEKAEKIARKKGVKFIISEKIRTLIKSKKYSIEEYQKAGLTLKDNDVRWNQTFEDFSKVVENEVYRSLKPEQLQSAFFMYTQKRAANFSVPGSGKTAMLLGVFAYLNRKVNPEVDRILVISPINAFMSWRDEFYAVFKDKKTLHDMSAHDEDVETSLDFKSKWAKSNLVMVNYESLPKFQNELIESLKSTNGRTMIVFDEVHRIKGVDTVRASAALDISKYVQYKYVLTGTPIPNGYIDIWNMLHLLYNDEYDAFFNFDKKVLNNPDDIDVETINERLQPFFWRTSKEDLGVPKAEEDVVIKVAPSADQIRLAEMVYATENSSLAAIIRMLQLSTNPELLEQKISFKDLGMSEIDVDSEDDEKLKTKISSEIDNLIIDKVKDMNVSNLESPKFVKGIELVKKLVSENKKVVVWGSFVGTLYKIVDKLRESGVNAELVYGGTKREDRDVIINRFKEDNNQIQVLVSNPNTLGESVSLHHVVHDAVYFEYNYNLTFMLQSRDRIHRLGLNSDAQTRYYYLMTDSEEPAFNFIDYKVYKRLSDKEALMKKAIETGILTPSYSDNEFDEMKQIIDSERK